jgi:L-threonylcarbamoyladenylate synthase
VKIVASTAEGIEEAAQAIRDGLLAVYPTETVYGLGADPFSPDAIARVFASKGRAGDVPLLLIAADLSQVAEVVETFDDAAARYAEAFWPGPLSLLLPRSQRLPEILTPGSGQVCVRIPDHEIARALCRRTGHAIVSTSANVSGEAPARSLDDLAIPGIAVAIDGGLLPRRPPSTVFNPATGTILRLGAITADMLDRVHVE